MLLKYLIEYKKSQDMLDGVVKEEKKEESFSGFAERRSK